MNYRRITLKGFPFFASQSFKLDRKGLTVIHGLNRDGGSTASKNSNAVGKSLFFSQIPDTLFPDTVTSKKKDRLKGGEVTLDVEDGGVLWRITRGKRVCIERKDEGATSYENVTPRLAGDQTDLLQRLVGRTATAFSVIDYLDNTKAHPLRTGDTLIRKQFFTEFFNLESADAIAKLVRRDKMRLKASAAALHELLKSRRTAPDIDVPDLERRIGVIERKLVALRSRLAEMTDARAHHRWLHLHGRVLSTLKDQSYSGLLAAMSEACSTLKACDLKIEQLRAASTYMADLRAYEKQERRVLAYAEEHGLTEDGLQKLKVRKRDIDAAAKTYASALDEWTQAGAGLRVQRRTEEGAFDKRIARLRADLEDQASVCPTCGQELKDAKDRRRHLRAEMRAIEAQKTDTLAALDEKIVALGEKPKAPKALSRLPEIEERIEVYASTPRSLDKPRAPANLKEASGSALEEVIKHRASIAATLDGLREVKADDAKRMLGLGAESVYSDEAYDQLTAQDAKLSTRLTTIQVTLDKYKDDLDHQATVEARIQELQDEQAELEVLTVLDEAFTSSTGVKHLMIRMLCRQLEDQVNKLAAHVYSGSVTFAFDLDSQFHITCTRHLPGGEVLVSDVRKLSGSESGLFNMLLSLALTSFLPKAKRSNIIVLDEVNANFGIENNDRFINFVTQVLPHLVDHVIVITPRSEDEYPDATYFTVVREGATSTIQKGRQ